MNGVARLKNPFSAEQFEQQLHRLAAEHGLDARQLVISITGGEPLAQAEFLQAWLPQWNGPVLLETAGIYPQRLEQLLPHLRYLSLDWKADLDLNAGQPLLNPAECLRLAAPYLANSSLAHPSRPLQLWVKLVVHQTTSSAWLQQSLRQIAELVPGVKVFLQPVTAGYGSFNAPPSSALLAELIQAHALPLDLRVLPQIHPFLGAL